MDAATLSLLQDSLGSGFRPVMPTLGPSPYASLQQGFDVGSQINAAIAAGQHAEQARASLAASQQQLALAAAKSPYEIALLKARADAIPLDKRYNQGLQDAQLQGAKADAALKSAKAQSYLTPAPSLDPIQPPAPIPDGTPAPTDNTSGTYTPPVNTFTPDTNLDKLTSPTFDLPSTGGNLPVAPVPLLGATSSTVPVDPEAPTVASFPTDLPRDVDLSTLAQVSGAEDPSNAIVYRNGVITRGGEQDDDPLPEPDNADGTANILGSAENPAADWTPVSNDGTGGSLDAVANYGGYRVPISEADLVSQRNYFNQRAARALANPAFTSNARNQRSLEAQLRTEAQQLAAAETQFRKSQSAKAATARRTPAPVETPDGFVSLPRTFSPRGISGEIRTSDELTDEQAKREAARRKEVAEYVKDVTGGASVGELLNDRGNYSDTLHREVPGQRFFMRSKESSGMEQPYQQSIPEDVYNRLRDVVDPVFRGKKYATADSTSGTTELPRVRLSLGPNAAVLDEPSTRPKPTTPASTGDRLQDAINRLPAGSDAEAEGEKAIQQVKQQTSEADRLKQVDENYRKSKVFQMYQQISPLEQEVQSRQAELEHQMQPDPEDVNGAARAPAVIARYTQALKESRAKLAAAQDSRNYVLGDDGAYYYRDPFRTNSAMTGQTQTAAGATTTRRVE